ncbi:hypothetical protein [Microcoleus sp. S13C4]|uniref:hypothetical protein n=1 Tax=Microcoleus sp. S13C4 TaxID=3055410 RepID=UPI002FD5B941
MTITSNSCCVWRELGENNWDWVGADIRLKILIISIILQSIALEGRRKKEEGRRKDEEGRRKKEEGRRNKNKLFPMPDARCPMPDALSAPCPMPNAPAKKKKCGNSLPLPTAPVCRSFERRTLKITIVLLLINVNTIGKIFQ